MLKTDGYSVLFPVERRFYSGDLEILRRDRGRFTAALRCPDVADASEDVGLEVVELLLPHLAKLDAHLRFQQPLTEHAVVVELAVHCRRDLVEHETDPGDKQAID